MFSGDNMPAPSRSPGLPALDIHALLERGGEHDDLIAVRSRLHFLPWCTKLVPGTGDTAVSVFDHKCRIRNSASLMKGICRVFKARLSTDHGSWERLRFD